MLASLVLTSIVAVFLYALSRRAWLAIVIPTSTGLVWLANYMGAFRADQNDTTALGMFVGFSPLFLLIYGLASGVGVAITKALATAVNRHNRRQQGSSQD